MTHVHRLPSIPPAPPGPPPTPPVPMAEVMAALAEPTGQLGEFEQSCLGYRGPYREVWCRGTYGQVVGTVAGLRMEDILQRFAACLPEEFSQWDRKKRGASLQFKLFGYDARRDAAVVQIRQSSRNSAKGFLRSRTEYVLVGFAAPDRPYRLTVEARVVNAAAKDDTHPSATVHAAERWLWNLTAAQHREAQFLGTVVVIPSSRPRATQGTVDLEPIRLFWRSHVLTSHEAVRISGGPTDGREIRFRGGQVHLLNSGCAPLIGLDEGRWYSLRHARVVEGSVMGKPLLP